MKNTVSIFLLLFSVCAFSQKTETEYYKDAQEKIDLEDYMGALEDLNKGIALKPDYIAAYYKRDVIKFYIEDYRVAIQDFNKAIELKPSYVHAYYMRGLSKIFLDINEGCPDLGRAFELGYVKVNYAIEKYCDQ